MSHNAAMCHVACPVPHPTTKMMNADEDYDRERGYNTEYFYPAGHTIVPCARRFRTIWSVGTGYAPISEAPL